MDERRYKYIINEGYLENMISNRNPKCLSEAALNAAVGPSLSRLSSFSN